MVVIQRIFIRSYTGINILPIQSCFGSGYGNRDRTMANDNVLSLFSTYLYGVPFSLYACLVYFSMHSLPLMHLIVKS